MNRKMAAQAGNYHDFFIMCLALEYATAGTLLAVQCGGMSWYSLVCFRRLRIENMIPALIAGNEIGSQLVYPMNHGPIYREGKKAGSKYRPGSG